MIKQSQQIIKPPRKTFHIQIEDEIKAEWKKATKAYRQYVEEPTTKPTKIAL